MLDSWDADEREISHKITESKLDEDLLRQKMTAIFAGKTPNLYMIKERTSTEEDEIVYKEIIAEYKKMKRHLWTTACQRLSLDTLAGIIMELEDGNSDHEYNDVNVGVISEFLNTI